MFYVPESNSQPCECCPSLYLGTTLCPLTGEWRSNSLTTPLRVGANRAEPASAVKLRSDLSFEFPATKKYHVYIMNCSRLITDMEDGIREPGEEVVQEEEPASVSTATVLCHQLSPSWPHLKSDNTAVSLCLETVSESIYRINQWKLQKVLTYIKHAGAGKYF